VTTAIGTTPVVGSARAVRVGPPSGSTFTGTRRLLWLVLRRDRFRIAMWLLGLIGLMAVSASSVVALYKTPEQLAGYARTVRGNSALIIQAGPGYGLENPTVAAIVMNETSLWMYIAVAVMNVFMVVRHTRTEEESERAELVRAAPVGRHAALASAMFGSVIVTAIAAAGNVVALLAFGLPVGGSLAFGASMTGIGAVFGGVAAVAAQVASGSRAALAAGGVAVGIAFVLRAIGDVGNGVLSWASPIGWAQGIRAYADERWWVLILPAAATAALFVAARVLQDRRDFGSGLVAPRAGRAEATRSLSTPLGLAVRLQRGALIGWAVGLGVLSFFYGLVADQAEKIIQDNPDMADFFAQLGMSSVTDAFLSTAMLIMALFASGFTVASVLRLRSEELAGRADPILATPVARLRWAAGHLLVAFVGTALLAFVCGLAMGAAAALVLGDAGRVAELTAAGLVMAPATWVLAGATVLLYGWRPRWALAAWAFVAWAFVAAMFGTLLELPQWLLDLSPYQHVPALPAAPMAWLPLVVLTVIAVVATAAGLRALARRDMS
jgi:polyether ionophore transport system permease protein